MIADVINIAIVGMSFCRAAVSLNRTWRLIYPLGRHLSVVVFHILLQLEAQNFLWSAYHAS